MAPRRGWDLPHDIGVCRYPAAVTEIAAAPSRTRIKLLVALLVAMALLAAAMVTAIVLLRGGGHEVRYEVETGQRSARLIVWTNGANEQTAVKGDSPDDPVDTPWSTTTVFEKVSAEQLASVSVAGDPADTATCRIFVDDQRVAESTKPGLAECAVTLASVIRRGSAVCGLRFAEILVAAA